MKVKNILIASAIAFGMVFTVADGAVFANGTNNTKIVTFEEFSRNTEQYAKWEQEHLAHIKKIQELKDEKRIKHMEYKAFKHNPNAEPEDISKAARDVVKLDRQIKTLNEEFLKNSREEYGLDFKGQKFHKDMTPCFKKHVDQFGEPMGPLHMGPRHKRDLRPCPYAGEKVPPHMRGEVPPHHYGMLPVPPCFKDMPPHMKPHHGNPHHGARFEGLPPHMRNIPETQAFDTMQAKPVAPGAALETTTAPAPDVQAQTTPQTE